MSGKHEPGPRELGEATRMRHSLTNIRGLISGLEQTIEMGLPCSEAAQAVADAATRLVAHAGAHDAFQRSEPETQAMIAYCDAAKEAAGPHRIGGEPLATTIARLRAMVAEYEEAKPSDDDATRTIAAILLATGGR
jgi:DNA-binding FrmR family transcriptional regulator